MEQLPMTEIEALRLLQAFNLVVQRNDEYSTQLLEYMGQVDDLKEKIEALTKENEYLKEQVRVNREAYLKLKASIIEGEYSRQAME